MSFTGNAAIIMSLIQQLFLMIVHHHWWGLLHLFPKHSPMIHHLLALRHQIIWIMTTLTGFHLVA